MTDCKHTSFSSEQVTVTGANMKIGIIRCSQCGTAIGTLYPQVPESFNKLAEGLETLYDEVKKLRH